MKEKNQQDINFSALFKDAKPVKQARYVSHNQRDKPSLSSASTQKLAAAKLALLEENKSRRQQEASVAISDSYEAHWPENKAIQYLRKGQNASETGLNKDMLKKLKLGFYPPDIEIDLHGCTAKQAKLELLEAIFESKKRHYLCLNIIHGHGSGVLKQKLPNWLVQHPDVAGFIQSPKAFGGKAGLLVIVGNDLSALK